MTAAPLVLAAAVFGLWLREKAPDPGPWTAQGVDQVRLRVASPYDYANLVEVDWLVVRREGPAGDAARKFLEDYAGSGDIATTQTAAEEYAKVGGIRSQRWVQWCQERLNAWAPDWVEPPLSDPYSWWLHAKADVVRLDGRVFSLCCQRSKYNHPGCSSGWQGWTAMASYDMATGEEIPVKDWLSSAKMEKTMEDLANEAFRLRAGLPANATITTNFPTACALAPDGVRVVFDFYLYRDPVEGMPWPENWRLDDVPPIEFTIPYAEFEGVIPDRWLPPSR